MPTISIHNTVPGTRIPRRDLLRLGQIVLKDERCSQNVNLIFIADSRMYELNKEYRGKDKTTDVLSFAMEDDEVPLLGEIYISIPEARRNAAEYGITPTQEILKLFCHGLLHLLGIHHPNKAKRAIMAAKEDKYLAKLRTGVAP
ncbi:MAG: rRNA maturation RNase YbeY [Candidatus Zixiibacteriota bacterium]